MRFGCFTAVIAIPTVVFGLFVLSNPYLRVWTGRVLFQTDRVIVLNGHGFRGSRPAKWCSSVSLGMMAQGA